MTNRRSPAWLGPLTDPGPLLLFFAVYLFADLMTATAALMAAVVAAVAVGWAVARQVPKLPLILAALVIVVGGLTLLLRDDVFIKMKPTIVQLLFAALLAGGVATKRSPLRFVMGHAMRLDDSGWRILGMRYALFFVAMAALNEAVWRTQSEAFWVTFKVCGLSGLLIAFTLLQIPLILRRRQPGSEG